MNRSRRYSHAFLSCALLLACVAFEGLGPGSAVAQTADVKAETIRPEIATALQTAEEMIQARKYQEALVFIGSTDKIADRTPSENFAIDRLRSIAALGAGDMATATRSLEAFIGSGRLSAAEKLPIMVGLIGAYFKAGDYSKAATWAAQYFTEGGTDAQTRMLYVRSLYLGGNFSEAANELRTITDAAVTAGTAPTQEQLQLLLGSYAKLNDSAGYAYALDKLLTYYPTKEYWADAIRRVEAKPGFADSLVQDALRLRQATGTLTSAAQYTTMIELAMKAGMPAEAKRIADLGFAAGVLGTGPDADVQRKMRDAAAKQATDDEKLLVQNAKDASAAKDGVGLVNVGFALVSAGQYEKGIEMMEQGIARGGLRRPDEARLHLAIAYLAAGQKAKAITAFQAVQGGDGTADLARLWLIHARRPTS